MSHNDYRKLTLIRAGTDKNIKLFVKMDMQQRYMMEKYIDEGYRQLEKAIKKYGSFHKVLFHLHTPASHDYKMLELSGNKRNVKDFSNEELFDIFAQTQILNREQIQEYWSQYNGPVNSDQY